MSEINTVQFAIDTYENIFLNTLSVSQSNYEIKSIISNDYALSLMYDTLKNIELSCLSASIAEMLDDFQQKSDTYQLSVRAKSIFNQIYGFTVNKYPTVINSSSSRSADNAIGLSCTKAMYEDALSSEPAVSVDIYNQSTANIPAHEINFSLSNILPNRQNIQIKADDIYELFTRLMVFLEKLKIFRYSYYYKITNFTGSLNVEECPNIYPELPCNSNTSLTSTTGYNNSYYAATLISPLATHYDIQQYDEGSGFEKTLAARSLKPIAASKTSFDISLIDSNKLIYTDDIVSEYSTFNLTTNDGSNGQFSTFKKITTETYDLHTQINDIIDLFNIKKGNVISSKNIKQAILYIFQLWHHNLKVFQCDFYSCHYNCHANNSLTTIGAALIEYKYVVKYIIKEDTFDYGIVPFIQLTKTQDNYQYFDDSSTILNIEYPTYKGQSEITSYMDALVDVQDPSSETIYEYKLTSLFDYGTYNASKNVKLYVHKNDEDKYQGEALEDHNYIIPIAGNISVYFKDAHSTEKVYSLDKCEATTISAGKIFVDQMTDPYPGVLTSFISLSARGLSSIDDIINKYEPKPTLTYHYEHTPQLCDITFTSDDLIYSYKDNNIITDQATVEIQVRESAISKGDIKLKFGGKKAVSFKVLPITPLYLNDEYHISIDFAEDVSNLREQRDKSPITPKIFVAERNSEEEGWKIIEDVKFGDNTTLYSRLFHIQYYENTTAGQAYVTVTPTLIAEDKLYGESYYKSPNADPIRKYFTILPEYDDAGSRSDQWQDGFTISLPADETPKYERSRSHELQIEDGRSIDVAITYKISRSEGNETDLAGYINVSLNTSGIIASQVYGTRIGKSKTDKEGTATEDGTIKFTVVGKQTLTIETGVLNPHLGYNQFIAAAYGEIVAELSYPKRSIKFDIYYYNSLGLKFKAFFETEKQYKVYTELGSPGKIEAAKAYAVTEMIPNSTKANLWTHAAKSYIELGRAEIINRTVSIKRSSIKAYKYDSAKKKYTTSSITLNCTGYWVTIKKGESTLAGPNYRSYSSNVDPTKKAYTDTTKNITDLFTMDEIDKYFGEDDTETVVWLEPAFSNVQTDPTNIEHMTIKCYTDSTSETVQYAPYKWNYSDGTEKTSWINFKIFVTSDKELDADNYTKTLIRPSGDEGVVYNPGSYEIVCTAKTDKGYSGVVHIYYDIIATEYEITASNISINGGKYGEVGSGTPGEDNEQPTVAIKIGNTILLTENIDYTIQWYFGSSKTTKFNKVGNYSLYVTTTSTTTKCKPKQTYKFDDKTGNYSYRYIIESRKIDSAFVDVTNAKEYNAETKTATFLYTGNKINPEVKLYTDDKLTNEIPTTSYSTKLSTTLKTVGSTATLTITGKNDYSGTITITCSVVAESLATATATYNEYNYATGSDIKPAVTLKNSDGVLISSNDYTCVYESPCSTSGTYDITIVGKNKCAGTSKVCYYYVFYRMSDITFTYTTSFEETGSDIKPEVTAKFGSTDIPSSYYTTTYDADCKSVGTHYIQVIGDNINIVGSTTLTYEITAKPAETTVE